MSNIICAQPLRVQLRDRKGMFRFRNKYQTPTSSRSIDPGASEVNQLNRIKLMIATAFQMRETRLTNTST